MVTRIFLKKMIKVLLCCGLILVNVSCARILQTTYTPEYTPDLKSGEYSMEIMRLKDDIKDHPRQSERIKAHYHLANLYSSYRNPKKDYKKALEQLDIYISLDSTAIKQNDVRNYLSLLREIDISSKELTISNRDLTISNRELTISNRKNSKLKQTIEKLQTLDFQVEQKRKSYR